MDARLRLIVVRTIEAAHVKIDSHGGAILILPKQVKGVNLARHVIQVGGHAVCNDHIGLAAPWPTETLPLGPTISPPAVKVNGASARA
jgi:hypothetical protein